MDNDSLIPIFLVIFCPFLLLSYVLKDFFSFLGKVDSWA